MTNHDVQLINGEELASLTATASRGAARAFVARLRKQNPQIEVRMLGHKWFKADIERLLRAAAEARALRPAAAALRASRTA